MVHKMKKATRCLNIVVRFNKQTIFIACEQQTNIHNTQHQFINVEKQKKKRFAFSW